MDAFEQCKGFRGKRTPDELKQKLSEGCQIFGSLEVNRVSDPPHQLPGIDLIVSLKNSTANYSLK